MSSVQVSTVDVINVVYHKNLERFGLSFKNQKHFLRSIPLITNVYMFKNPEYRLPKKESHECLFVSFKSLINQEPNPVVTTETSLVISTKLTSLEDTTHHPYDLDGDAIPASYKHTFGILFASYQCLCLHFSGSLADFIDDDCDIPDVSRDQVAFISLESMLTQSKTPIQILSKQDVSIHYMDTNISKTLNNNSRSVLKSSRKISLPNSVSFMNTAVTTTLNERTPAIALYNAANGKNTAATFCNTGITTIETATSSLDRNSLTNVTMKSRPAFGSENPASSDDSSHHTNAVPQVHANVAVAVTSSTSAVSTQEIFFRIPGPSDMKQDIGYNNIISNSSSMDTLFLNVRSHVRETRGQGLNKNPKDYDFTIKANQFYKDNWAFMSKDELGWKCVYVKTGRTVLSGDNIEVYVIPSLRTAINFNLNKLNAIENLEYFHSKDALYSHVAENPSILDSWDELWSKLYQAGWRAVGEMENNSEKRLTYLPAHYELYFADKYCNTTTTSSSMQNKFVPGLHKFVSRQALRKYISRFPFLLQPDHQFIETLKRFNWEINPKNRVKWEYDSSFETNLWDFQVKVTSRKDVDWISFDKLKERLWMCPACLFKNLNPCYSADLFLSAISLEESEALAADQGPFTPYVHGLSREERDEVINNLNKIFPKYMKKVFKSDVDISQEEELLKNNLLRLNWEYSPAYFLTNSWKKMESVWISPWLKLFDDDNKKLILGRDYFWSLSAIYRFVMNHNVYAYVEQPRPFKNIDVEFNTQSELELTNHKLRYIANLKKSEKKWPIEEMLQGTGWKVIEISSNRTIYIPHWATSKVTEDNYDKFKRNEDYFMNQTDILDHLAGYGNDQPDINDSFSEQSSSPMIRNECKHSMISSTQLDHFDDETSENDVTSQILSEIKMSTSKFVLHQGFNYEIESHEGFIIQALKQEKPYFSIIYTKLKEIGWYSAYDPKKKFNIICPPWTALEVPNAFPDGVGRKKNVDTDHLVRDLHYFIEDETGKQKLLDHLKNIGFNKTRLFNTSKKSSSEVKTSNNNTSSKHIALKSEKVIIKDTQVSQVEASSNNFTVPSASKFVLHQGFNYELGSLEGFIIQALKQEKPYFPKIYSTLKEIGWYSAYDPKKKFNIICPPWTALEVPNAFPDGAGRGKNVDTDHLVRDLHYFIEDETGKQKLLDHLKNIGFNKTRLFNTSKKSSSEVKAIKNSIEHLGIIYTEPSPEWRVLNNLKTVRHFSTIFSYLKTFLDWGVHYDEVSKLTLICAPWSLEIPNAFSCDENKSKYKFKLKNSLVLLRHVDYFIDNKDDKELLLTYIEKNGFKRVTAFASDIASKLEEEKANSLTIRKRSPARACWKATEPDQMMNRYVSDHPSPEINHTQNNAPVDYAFDKNTYSKVIDMIEKDSPNQFQDEVEQHDYESDENSEIISLLTCEKPNFSRIFSFLTKLEEPWTYEYLTDKSVLPNGESAIGRKVIYLRPGCKLKSDKTTWIKDEDYFLTTESLLDYLKVHFGIIKESTYNSDMNKPKALRNGKKIVTTNNNIDPILGISIKNKQQLGIEQEEDEDQRKQQSLSPRQETSNHFNKRSSEDLMNESSVVLMNKKPKQDENIQIEFLPMNERIQFAKQNFKSATASSQGIYENGVSSDQVVPTNERTIQHDSIFNAVRNGLENAQPAMIYVCGSPGLGKTLTVMKALSKIETSRKQIIEHIGNSENSCMSWLEWAKKSFSNEKSRNQSLGYNMVFLNGTQLTKKQDAYATIAERLGLFKSNDTIARADAINLLSKYFSTRGESVKITSTYHNSESMTTNNTVPMTVLVIDEFDIANSEVAKFLVRIIYPHINNECQSSSLILLGIGNCIALPDMYFSSNIARKIQHVIFPHYTSEQLISILKRITGEKLFHSNAAILLASKVLKNNKGDVRCLLSLAEKCLQTAEEEFNTKSTNSTENVINLVEVKHVKLVCDKKDATIGLIESLPAKCKAVLISLLMYIEEHPNENSFSLHMITREMNHYLHSKSIEAESSTVIQTYIEQLADYCLLEITKNSIHPDKVVYRVPITSKFILQAKMGEMFLGDMRRAILRAANNREASLIPMSQV